MSLERKDCYLPKLCNWMSCSRIWLLPHAPYPHLIDTGTLHTFHFNSILIMPNTHPFPVSPKYSRVRYNAVKYNIIFQIQLPLLTQNINRSLDSQRIIHTSPSRASYGVSIVRNLKKIDHIITAPRCTKHLSIGDQWLRTGIFIHDTDNIPADTGRNENNLFRTPLGFCLKVMTLQF